MDNRIQMSIYNASGDGNAFEATHPNSPSLVDTLIIQIHYIDFYKNIPVVSTVLIVPSIWLSSELAQY